MSVASPYYTSDIQLERSVIEDILKDIFESFSEGSDQVVNMLVFGLGHDSRMWYEATKHRTYFVEHNPIWIERLDQQIPREHVFHYDYPTTVEASSEWTVQDLSECPFPPGILDHAPFDIILIDGPTGFNDQCPGRLLPCFWSARRPLSHPGTRVYMDDALRPLEKKCIQKFFVDRHHVLDRFFHGRGGCAKFIVQEEK